jgi:hypothetical protein
LTQGIICRKYIQEIGGDNGLEVGATQVLAKLNILQHQ